MHKRGSVNAAAHNHQSGKPSGEPARREPPQVIGSLRNMPAHRWSLPALQGARGAGFGNEVIAWGKAFIGAQELGCTAVHPAWSLNPRGYRRDFGTSRLDWPLQQALRLLPTVTVTTEMAAKHVDYADAMTELKKRPQGWMVVKHDSGMSGGYMGIWRARTYLRAQLEQPKHVARDMYEIERALSADVLRVAMHVRVGDFDRDRHGPQPGQFNVAVPPDWYASVAATLREALGPRIQFTVLTDDPASPDVRSLISALGAVVLPGRAKPFISDLLTMISSDLLVCSVSSLSMFAAFASDRPYLWFEPHLNERGGWLSIWGHEASQGGKVTRSNEAVAKQSEALLCRGSAANPSGALPSTLLEHLERLSWAKARQYDLIAYGVIPTTAERKT